ncbi:LacI family transcriptional regulator [Deinococcus seoulensis]|uniref:LacI family transcriptional regulator n=2 Tax=Deinococcus seoulensis TaxID=1837379 RepID=A0ABQ2RR24_9DEIO|nr:LacI family transcriptional regulator [Deinococcus seoulensis]
MQLSTHPPAPRHSLALSAMVKPTREAHMPTIKDVAAHAGVSASTVHYALNGKRSISPEVRQRVLDAVQALNYSASAVAQRLREHRSYSLGLIAPELPASDAAMMEILTATAATASAADHTLGIYLNQAPDQILGLLRAQHVDGVILIETAHHDPRIEALRHAPHPFVLIGQTGDMTGLTTVDFDFEQAFYLAFDHLARLGHRHLGFIVPHGATDDDQPQRKENWYATLRGYRRARQEHDLHVELEPAVLNIEDGHRAALRLTARAPRVTGIVASGHTQVGVLRALYSQGRRVPDDCSVVGVTTAQIAEWTIPRLTSVDLPLREMSVTASELLLRKVGGEAVTEQVLFPAYLIDRESTAPPRTAQPEST